MKKFSIIITTYNSENSIQRLLNSINSQKGLNTLFEIEILLIDDCSKDKTTQILKENGINYLSTEINSGGPNKGRNIGLNLASGDYICITDHDDEWNTDRLFETLPYLEIAPIVTSGYTVLDKTTGITKDRLHKPSNNSDCIEYGINSTFISKLTKSIHGQISYLGGIVYHASLKHIFFEEQFGQLDFDWVLKLFENKSSIEICKTLYSRHIDGSNLSMNELYRLRDFEFSLKYIEKYRDSYPKQTEIANRKLHGSLARYYYVVNNMKKARSFFLKSELNIKTILYFLTTFAGAKFVKKHFSVFG